MGKGRGLSPYVSEASPVGITPGYGQVVFLPPAPPPFESFPNSLIFSTRSVFHSRSPSSVKLASGSTGFDFLCMFRIFSPLLIDLRTSIATFSFSVSTFFSNRIHAKYIAKRYQVKPTDQHPTRLLLER